MDFAKDVVDNVMNLFSRKPVRRQVERKDRFSDYEDMKPIDYGGRLQRIPGVDRRADMWNKLAVPQCKLCN